MNQEIPSNIVWRKSKVGFELPESEILDTLEPELMKLIDNSAIIDKITHKNKLISNFTSLDKRTKWRLYNIIKWEEIFKVKV
jgi:hypothetical protein